jgi:phage tail protein X
VQNHLLLTNKLPVKFFNKSMPTLFTKPGDTIASLASDIFDGDVLRFTEILDLNPNLDVFGELVDGVQIVLPDVQQVFNYAKPKLGAIASTITSATDAISAIQEKLPDKLKGYTSKALELLGEINGVVGEVESTLTKVEEQVGEYSGEPVKLVQWLLGNASRK